MRGILMAYGAMPARAMQSLISPRQIALFSFFTSSRRIQNFCAKTSTWLLSIFSPRYQVTVHSPRAFQKNPVSKGRKLQEQVVLALRKWYDVRPEMEFRGFVRNNSLLGICQREVTGFYETLLEREDKFTDLILDFWMENLKDDFGGGDYTFDVYVTKENKVKLMDFNTWGGITLPLLFSWEELEEKFNEATQALPPHVECRLVTSEGLVQLGLRVGTCVPIDFANQGAWENIIRRESEREAHELERGRAGA